MIFLSRRARKQQIACFLLCIHATALHAQSPAIRDPLTSNDELIKPQSAPQAPEPLSEPVLPPSSHPSTATPQLTLEQLQKDPALTGLLINRSIVNREWHLLRQLLPIYQAFPEHDGLLVLYAQGILYRLNAEHGKAIAAYRDMLSQDPDLLYVRFDLAIMLYENKEYEAALDQFRKVMAGDLGEEFRRQAESYIERAQGHTHWQFSGFVQPERNDNVNQASSIRSIPMGSGSLSFADAAEPKSDLGLRYYFSADKSENIRGGHSLTYGGSVYGVQYHKETDYNEIILRGSVGYQYQDVKNQFNLSPFYEKNWLGAKPYLNSPGVDTQYRYWLKSNVQLSLSHTFMRKHYRDSLMDSFDSRLNALGLTGVYFYSPRLIFLAGLDFQREKAQSAANSFKRHGWRAGIIREFEQGLSARLDWRYSRKQHDGKLWPQSHESFLLSHLERVMGADVPRRDTEYRGTLTIWHRNLHFRGITPKISYSHSQIRSSIPLLYQRKNNSVYLNFEKTF